MYLCTHIYLNFYLFLHSILSILELFFSFPVLFLIDQIDFLKKNLGSYTLSLYSFCANI